jgi:hypothetical protein
MLRYGVKSQYLACDAGWGAVFSERSSFAVTAAPVVPELPITQSHIQLTRKGNWTLETGVVGTNAESVVVLT